MYIYRTAAATEKKLEGRGKAGKGIREVMCVLLMCC
jgi:hypothetical protein